MASADSGQRGKPKGGLYLDMVDLYAARAMSARTVVAADARPIPVTPLPATRATSRIPRFQFRIPGRVRRLRVANAVLAALVAGSMVTGTASANQTYLVQPGDTVQSIARKFDVDAVELVDTNEIWGAEYLYEGQALSIPGTADADLGTGYIAGTYTVQPGDSVASVAWDLHVSTADLLAVNGLSADDYIYAGDVLLVPDSTATRAETLEALDSLDAGEIDETIDDADAQESATTGSGLPASAFVWVPNYYQQRNLSCEYASTFIATSAFGAGVPESAFWNWIPVTSNPHWGYRGNIDGWWGNTTDYGIYPEPLVPVLNYYGFAADVFYGGSDATRLMQELANGHPVVTWLAMWGNTGEFYQDEGSYTVFSGMHVMTAYGYDINGIYLSDPATGTSTFYDWGTFLWMWSAIDGMAMAVYPY